MEDDLDLDTPDRHDEADDALLSQPHCDCGRMDGLSRCELCGDLCCVDCLKTNTSLKPPQSWCLRCTRGEVRPDYDEEFSYDDLDL